MMSLYIKNFIYFFLKREIYYHKIQYSKVFKHDIAAAIFGVVIGAFVVYLSLNTLGSGSPDLSDLSILLWYILLLYLLLLNFVVTFKYSFFYICKVFFIILFYLLKFYL